MQIATAPFAAYAGYADVAGELVPDERAGIISDTLDDAAALFSPIDHEHSWSEIMSIPAGFADGIDNELTEAQVDEYANNNGYLTSSSSLAWGNLNGIPAGFADGIDNVLSELQVDAYANNNGYITTVTAGAGLSGGGTSGAVTLNFAPTVSAEFNANVIGEGGVTSDINMTNVSNRFCYLTRVRIPDDNDEDDASRCIIYISGSVWRLDAYTTADEAGNTECGARCVSW